MKQNKWMLSTILLAALLVAVTVGACASPASASGGSSPAPTPSYTASSVPAASAAPFTVEKDSLFYYRNQKMEKYTKEEYSLALSFMVDGWQDMSIADFYAKLFPNVKDEKAFHAVYDPLQNVLYQYEGTDPNAAFLDSLSRTVKEASGAHYNACAHDQLPWMWGNAEYKRYEDVYGDKVQVASGYLDFSYGYSFPDASKVTVKARDEFFKNMEQGAQAFLDKQSETDLKNAAAMEKTLAAELGKLAVQYGGGAITVSGGEVSYYWEPFY